MNISQVSAAALAWCVLAGCENREEIVRLRKEFDETLLEEQRISIENRALFAEVAAKRRLINQYDWLQDRETELLRMLDPVENYAASLMTAHRYLDEQLATWKALTRESLKGLDLGTFKAVDGTVFESARVSEVFDDHAVISVAGSERNFRFEELPPAIRSKLVDEETVVQQSRINGIGN